MLPNILLNIVMGVGAYFISFLPLNIYVVLIIQVVVGVSIYWGLSIAFKNDSYTYFIEMIKTKVFKKKDN